MELWCARAGFVLYYCCRVDRVSISRRPWDITPKLGWPAMNIFLCSSRFYQPPLATPPPPYPLHHFTIIYIPSTILFSHSFFLCYFPRVQNGRSVLFLASTVLDLKNRPKCLVNSITFCSYFSVSFNTAQLLTSL